MARLMAGVLPLSFSQVITRAAISFRGRAATRPPSARTVSTCNSVHLILAGIGVFPSLS